MAPSLPRWTVPAVVGVVLLALAATSLILWLVKGDGSGSVDATDEIAFACGIDKQVGDIDPDQKLPDRTEKGADTVDDLGLELMLINAAGLHDRQYAAAGKSAEKAYQHVVQYFDLGAFAQDRPAVTAPCSHVAATAVPADPTARLGAYADFGCRLSASIRDAGPQVKKLRIDSPVVGDMQALSTAGQTLTRSDKYRSRGKAFTAVGSAFLSLDQDRLDEALSAVAKGCD